MTRKHLHRYNRKRLGKNGYTVYKCMVPGCSHYVRRELVEGMICECNRCHQPMTMDKQALQLSKPHCRACVVHKNQDVHDAIKEFLVKSGQSNEDIGT